MNNANTRFFQVPGHVSVGDEIKIGKEIVKVEWVSHETLEIEDLDDGEDPEDFTLGDFSKCRGTVIGAAPIAKSNVDWDFSDD